MFNLKAKKEDPFYIMFSKCAKNVNEGAIILRESLNSLENKKSDLKKTEALEDKGDEIVRDVIRELNVAFITPIDREDIYSVVTQIDNTLNLINSTMHRFIMFNIDESTEEAKHLVDILVQATTEVSKLMDELRVNGCKSKNIQVFLENISKYEHSADKLFRKTVAELFRDESNPLNVMKWKEIYQTLEDTIDNCAKVANIVEGVVIKNA